MNIIEIKAPDLLSVQQTATLLNKPRLAIYRWIWAGKLHALKFGGILYIPVSEFSCSFCFHRTDNLCACREPNDMISTAGKCPDWHHKK